MMLPFFKKVAVANKNIARRQPYFGAINGLEPVHYIFGLQRITELYRRLELMRTTMKFKGPEVITYLHRRQ